jgi:hypothetical protein
LNGVRWTPFFMGRPIQIGARMIPIGKCSMRLPRWCDRLFMAIMLLASMSPALAFPPPPDKPPLLRQASMTVTVTLIEAANGQVFRITELCKVSGKIPVYADDGNAASWHLAQIHGCHMLKKGKKLPVAVSGVMAVSKKTGTYARAYVKVVATDAVPLCPDLCGPQPLADSDAEMRVSGSPRSLKFKLDVNPVSLLNAKPTVWLDAEVEMVDAVR